MVLTTEVVGSGVVRAGDVALGLVEQLHCCFLVSVGGPRIIAPDLALASPFRRGTHEKSS
jgi:hypothetical protein